MCPQQPPGEQGGTALTSPTAQADETIGCVGPVRLADGAELVGEFRGSGYRETPHLVQRLDGQLVRLPTVLYEVAKILDEQRRSKTDYLDDRALLAAVANKATRTTELTLEVEHIVFLLDHKLAPLGVTTYSDGTPPPLPKPTPFLSLRLRMRLLPERGTWLIGGALSWLFNPHILIVLIGLTILAEVWVFTTQNVASAMQQSLLDPISLLAVVLLAVISTAFHECGHATACRYGGVAPGAMGCGIYLVWPAFYTDITNSYRLSRGGRLRADMGGVYFNGLFVIVLVGCFMITGWIPLLVTVVAINLEIIQQLLPTLRFDGYYIASDLVGIPDLFKYIGPILKRVVLRQSPDPRLTALKQWPQIIVTLWVLLVIPALTAQLSYIAWQLPGLVNAGWLKTVDTFENVGLRQNPTLAITAGIVQVILFLLPIAGVSFILFQLGRTLLRLAHRRWQQRTPTPHPKRRAAWGVAVLLVGITPLLATLAWPLLSGAPSRRPAAIAPPPPTTHTTPSSPKTPPVNPQPPPSDSELPPRSNENVQRTPTREPATYGTPGHQHPDQNFIDTPTESTVAQPPPTPSTNTPPASPPVSAPAQPGDTPPAPPPVDAAPPCTLLFLPLPPMLCTR